jgi:hypothetical protein
MESLTGFSRTQLEAIEAFLRSCTIPLVGEEDKKLALLGMGTFFSLDGQLWLVTAAHVVKHRDDLKELAVPMRSLGRFITLGNCCLYRPSNLDLDVALIHIQDADFKRYVSENWRVLDDSNVIRFDPSASRYIVAGYPRETLANKNMDWHKAFTQIHAGPYSGGAADASHPVFRLAYSRSAPDLSGAVTDTPDLHGVSGASVWAVVNAADGIWAPEKALKIVAVQVSFKHSEYIGAEWWTLVREVLHRWSADEASSPR